MNKYKFINDIISDKKVLILGYGKEGKSTYNILRKLNSCSILAIADKNPIETDNKVNHIGDDYLEYINDYDIVFKSPGIALYQKEYNAIITSQTEVFFSEYHKQIIGVTATKGKSTTTSLIYQILKNQKLDVLLGGNIGIPFFDLINDLKEDSIIVSEVACHQLENIKVSPHIAVILNIYEDHLDHYLSFDHYKQAKLNITRYQNESDYLFISDDLKEDMSFTKASIIKVTKDNIEEEIINNFNKSNLKGNHNLSNAAIAYNVSKLFNIKIDSFINTLLSFKPLEHRIQYVITKNNISYYDDSISTTAESTIAAINSIDNLETIILGGLDRGIHYEKLVEALNKSNLKNIILTYKSGKRIYELMSTSNKNVYYFDELKEAIVKASEITSENKSCILSPAAASYGYFKNFIERGNYYQKIINEI